MKDKILNQFDKGHPLFANFVDKCKGIILELLNDNSISIHHITARIKNRDSLEKKIEIKNNKYSDISEITDICGIRIITYLDSDVNSIAQLIEKEFLLDANNSIDKRTLKSDQFGYKSLHYVVSLNEQRSNITENKKYTGYKIEIQIRSILQHAWAEIEHDLGYKGEVSIPESFKRSFNRLAALLETADIEFDRLKKDLSTYEVKVKEDIKNNPNMVLIDQASISSFIKTNKIFELAKGIISTNMSCVFVSNINFYYELSMLNFFHITTIGQLEKLVNENQVHYLSFVDLFTKKNKNNRLSLAIPLFYFFHFIALKKESVDYFSQYLKYGDMQANEASIRDYFSLYTNSKVN